MERRTTVQVIQVMLYCDECGGRMQPTGVALLTEPPKYPHECPDCGHGVSTRKVYPYLEYEENN